MEPASTIIDQKIKQLGDWRGCGIRRVSSRYAAPGMALRGERMRVSFPPWIAALAVM